MKKTIAAILAIIASSYFLATCTYKTTKNNEETNGSYHVSDLPMFSTDEPTGRITGQVEDEHDGRPIKAKIHIIGTRLQTCSRIESDGTYDIDNIPPGTYSVRAEQNGIYIPLTAENIGVEAGKIIKIIFKLQRRIRGSYTVHYYTSVDPTTDYGQIIGRVIDKSTKEPIESAIIHINHGMRKDTLTDSLGEYQLNDIRPGTNCVSARTENIGYRHVHAEGIKIEKGKQIVINFELVWDPSFIGAYEVAYEPSTECSTSGKIRIKTIDRFYGSYIPSTRIRLPDSQIEAHTNESGICDLHDLAPGFYNIEAKAFGYNAFLVRNAEVKIGTITIINIQLAQTIYWVD